MTAQALEQEEELEAPRINVPTWKFIWGTITFLPVRYLFNNLAMIVTMLGWQIPALVIAAFFDYLSAYPDNWYTVGYEHRDNDEALARSYPKQQDDNGLPYLR
ncbi:MAG: hypothetical protein Fur005_07040 [Roseiflexaceae bacterium]